MKNNQKSFWENFFSINPSFIINKIANQTSINQVYYDKTSNYATMCFIYTCCSLNIFPFSNRSQFSAFPIFQARVLPSNAFPRMRGSKLLPGQRAKRRFLVIYVHTNKEKLGKQGRKEVPGKEWLWKVINFIMIELHGLAEKKCGGTTCDKEIITKIESQCRFGCYSSNSRYFMCCRSFFHAIKAFLWTFSFICFSFAFTMCKYFEWKQKLLIIL